MRRLKACVCFLMISGCTLGDATPTACGGRECKSDIRHPRVISEDTMRVEINIPLW